MLAKSAWSLFNRSSFEKINIAFLYKPDFRARYANVAIILDLPYPDGTTHIYRCSVCDAPSAYWATANYLSLGVLLIVLNITRIISSHSLRSSTNVWCISPIYSLSSPMNYYAEDAFKISSCWCFYLIILPHSHRLTYRSSSPRCLIVD